MFLYELKYQNKKYQIATNTLLERYSFEELFPADKKHLFSADTTTRLMLLYLLERMKILPPGTSSTYIDSYMDSYKLDLQEFSEDQLKQALYFISHVVFVKSDLGTKNITIESVTDEKRILENYIVNPDIVNDNDLWPEMFLALSLIESCPSIDFSDKLRLIIQSQYADGSWQPSNHTDTLKFHTTSVIYLSLLSYQRCVN